MSNKIPPPPPMTHKILKNNTITPNLKEATHIKLVVHISDTLPYISPENSNYYYHYSKYKRRNEPKFEIDCSLRRKNIFNI